MPAMPPAPDEERVMATQIRRVDYFYVTVEDQPGEAYKVLSHLAEQGVDLVAMTSMPIGPNRTQMTLFPAETDRFAEMAAKAGMVLDGPYPALLVMGDDEPGALARVHAQLSDAGVNVYASTGVASGGAGFGYVLYVRPDEYDRATAALGI
jgi:prephenate dehydratase